MFHLVQQEPYNFLQDDGLARIGFDHAHGVWLVLHFGIIHGDEQYGTGIVLKHSATGIKQVKRPCPTATTSRRTVRRA